MNFAPEVVLWMHVQTHYFIVSDLATRITCINAVTSLNMSSHTCMEVYFVQTFFFL